MTVEYIPRTRQLYASQEPYRWVVNEDIPWTPLAKPLARCRVALASSAGVYLEGQEPFHFKDDTSIREIPRSAQASSMRVSHFGYRTEDARRDPNCVFPLERMRELEAQGLFGELAECAYTFMGGVYSARRVREELAPQILERVREMKVDLLYMVPA